MRKYFVILMIFLISVIGTNAWATTMTGNIFGPPPNGLYGTDGWSTATLSWNIIYPDASVSGHYEYNYTFTVFPQKGISHLIIEVSDNFESADMLPGTTPGGLLDDYSSSDQGDSNPGMPAEFHGIKWDTPANGPTYTYRVKIVTDRDPMMGNFYAKDGQDNGVDVYAYSGDTQGFLNNVPVPDTTTTVPEPATMLLLGSGLIGLAGFARRKFKK